MRKGAAIRGAATSAGTWAITVNVRVDRDGPVVAREPVTESDLVDLKSEAWMASVLRRGHPDTSLEEIEPRVVPVFRDADGLCTGIAIESNGPDGTARHPFTIRGLHHVAARAARRLLDTGELKANDIYYYRLTAERVTPADARGAGATGSGAGANGASGASVASGAAASAVLDDAPFTMTTQSAAPRYLSVPIAPLLARGTAIGGPVAEGSHRVFYTAQAFARAERFARKGGQRVPAVETGAVLVGPLCSCPETGDLFVVVCDVIEILDAEMTKFSLAYTGKTWARIQALSRATQAQPATRAHRIVGQAHGHNFLPQDGAPPCEACATSAVCDRTSVFVSDDDMTWSRAVFCRQPWHLCHIFGLNARREEVHGLFTLRDGRLQETGFFVIREFDPGSH